jgi:hypothetical protein
MAPDALPALMPAAKADPVGVVAEPRPQKAMGSSTGAAGKRSPRARKKRVAAVRDQDAQELLGR